MKYWITTFQATGVTLFAGAVIAEHDQSIAAFYGAWLIIAGGILNGLFGGGK
ncbi:MAG: hypothetical protein MJ061_04790 [Mailhella sp.]|nr:hypothetical protein [Mailhella sp.]